MLGIDYKNKLINSINVFCKNINCSNCGGTYNYQNFKCEYCSSFNSELKESYKILISIISNLKKDDLDKEVSLYLYKLAKSSNDFEYLFESFDLSKRTEDIIKNLEGVDEYSREDVKLLECIFNSDAFLDIDNVLRDIILRNVILRKNKLSKDLIEKVLSHLVLTETRKISKDSKFYISDLGDEINGTALYYYVHLDRDVMDAFYDNGNILVFYVLPHEIRHTYRTYFESQGMVTSIFDILALKEKLLRQYNQDIYFNNKNYVKSFREIESNVFSYYSGTKYLRSLGFEIDEKLALELSSLVNNDLTNLTDPLREIDGQIININELFSEFIKNQQQLFYKYPQLHYEFKEEDEKIVYKNLEELLDEFAFNKDKNLDEVYLKLIGNAIKREEVKNIENNLKSRKE